VGVGERCVLHAMMDKADGKERNLQYRYTAHQPMAFETNSEYPADMFFSNNPFLRTDVT
jgi:hypothetical protein